MGVHEGNLLLIVLTVVVVMGVESCYNIMMCVAIEVMVSFVLHTSYLTFMTA